MGSDKRMNSEINKDITFPSWCHMPRCTLMARGPERHFLLLTPNEMPYLAHTIRIRMFTLVAKEWQLVYRKYMRMSGR